MSDNVLKMPVQNTVEPEQVLILRSGADIHDVGYFIPHDNLIEIEIPRWEQLLHEKIEESQETVADLTEGTVTKTTLSKYERNPKARAECLKAHGTACKVCGIDFAKTYGPEFAGKIEVHHIVPLSVIGEKYVVDPVKDLIPLCPNCHTAIHNKPDGVYSVEELKKILKVTR